MRLIAILLLMLSGCLVTVKSIAKQISGGDNLFGHHEVVEEINLPDTFVLDVPFVPQAPFANWDIHNDSCEEAGILLAHYYYQGEDLTKEQADQELRDMIQYQMENFGGHEDIFTEMIARLAREYYGYQPRIIEVDIDRLKEEIYAGNPVILLTTAAYLKPEKNDYPEMGYHIIDAIGYNQYGIVTHDVGTITGEKTTYSNHIIMNAIADYDNLAVILK